MHLLIWGPLDTWAERFHIEESGNRPRTPRMARVLARSRIVRWFTRTVVIPTGQQSLGAVGGALGAVGRSAGPLAGRAAGRGPGRRPGDDGSAPVAPLRRPAALARRCASIPIDLLLSFLRVAWRWSSRPRVSVPVAAADRAPSAGARAALAVIQILASIPATAFFPLIVVLLTWGLGMNAGAVLLALTTMFWYVLFNVMGAAAAIPQGDAGGGRSRSASTACATCGACSCPRSCPGLVTGCVTAWGAGWNAMILCEYVEAGREALQRARHRRHARPRDLRHRRHAGGRGAAWRPWCC